MKLTLLILSFCFCLCSQLLVGQDAGILKKSGVEFLAAKKYSLALDAFLKYEQALPGDMEVTSSIGICYFHLNNLAEAENYLYQTFHTKSTPLPVIYLYLGKLHHAKLEFEQAAVFYKKFLQNTAGSSPHRATVKDDIRRCATGAHVNRQSAFAAVVNLGEVVNGPGDDFKPILSPNDDERLYFSSIRPGNAGCTTEECKADMFFTELRDGDWDTPRPLSVFLNSIQHEVAFDFGDDGAHLYFFRGETLYSGDILIDTFRSNATERTLFSPEFNGPMRAWEGDRAPYFFKDSILLFASRRAGGFGGLDLYFSTFTRGGWTVPQNLGPTINTPYDEMTPFLSLNGRTLYFSSNDAHRSIGGLDILKSTYLDHTQRWSPPENLGAPLNSAEDDEQFVLTADGTMGFFASARRQGLGQRDLYVALFDQVRPEQAAQSLPIAFHLVPVYREALKDVTEASGTPEDDFFDEISSFEWPLLAAPDPAEPLPEETLKTLRILALLMKKFPAAEVTVAVHTATGDNTAAICANVFRRTELLLKKEGARVENLRMLCAGPSWPVDPNRQETNRRVEIYVSNPEILPFELKRSALPAAATDARFFQKTMSSLWYQVVVDISSDPEQAQLHKIQELYPKGKMEERPAQDRTYFTLGFYLTYASAEEWRKNLERDGYREARIAAYLNGWEISKAEAMEHMAEFPDLKNFIKN